MRITWDPLSFCENDISKNSANLDRKGRRQYTLRKGHWTSKVLLAEKKLRKLLNYTHMCYLSKRRKAQMAKPGTMENDS